MPNEKEITRISEREINPLLLNRWSPRALSGESLSEEELMSLFEAAKWAPSCYNNQPWRFIYVQNGTPAWEKLYSILTAGNKVWTVKAAALVLVVSRLKFELTEQPNYTSSFDCGSAWENLALEAYTRGLVAHGMSGFDYEAARVNMEVPETYKIEMMIAVGRPGQKEDLSPELQAIEQPSDRKKIQEIVSEGKFDF